MTPPSARPESSRPADSRNHALDGLRGWAAMAVIFYHTILGPSPRLIPDVLHPSLLAMHGTYQVLLKVALSLLNGEVAVELFFVLSGLVLFRSLMNDRGPLPLVAARFAIRRFLRIWPPMAVALLVNVALFRAIDPLLGGQLAAFTGLHGLLSNLLLLSFPVNGATWTLHAEIFVVPLLLLVWCAARRLGWVAVLGFLLVCTRQQWMARLALHDIYVQATAFFFALGMVVERGLLNPLFRWRRLGAAAGLGSVVGLFAATMLLPEGHHLRGALQGGSLAVLVAYAFRTKDGLGIRFLVSAPSQLVGRLSFSLYLWNVPIFEILLALTPAWLKESHPLETGLGVGLAAALLVLPVAWVAERYVEQPCIALGRRVLRRRAAPQRDGAPPDAAAPPAVAPPVVAPPAIALAAPTDGA